MKTKAPVHMTILHRKPAQACVRWLAPAIFLASVLLLGPGCRTVNMTDEEWQQEQQGIYHESPGEEATWWGLGQALEVLGIIFSGK